MTRQLMLNATALPTEKTYANDKKGGGDPE
jgi:hypothetical protein